MVLDPWGANELVYYVTLNVSKRSPVNTEHSVSTLGMKCFNILLGSKTTVHRLQREEPHQPFPPEEEEEEELFQPSANARAALTPRKVPGSDNPLKLNTSRNFSAACANESLQIQQFPRCPLSLLLPTAVRAGQERESLPVPRAGAGGARTPTLPSPAGH